jgi:tetratricopeptide (TPR) repeat protein
LGYNSRGISYAVNKQYAEAITDFDYGIGIKTEYVKTILNRGITHIFAEEYEEAIEDINNCLTINKNSAEACLCLGIAWLSIAYLKRGDDRDKDSGYSTQYNKAIRFISEATNLKPDFMDVVDMLNFANKKRRWASAGNTAKQAGKFLLGALNFGMKTLETQHNNQIAYAEKHGMDVEKYKLSNTNSYTDDYSSDDSKSGTEDTSPVSTEKHDAEYENNIFSILSKILINNLLFPYEEKKENTVEQKIADIITASLLSSKKMYKTSPELEACQSELDEFLGLTPKT